MSRAAGDLLLNMLEQPAGRLALGNLDPETTASVGLLQSLGALAADQAARTIRLDDEGTPRDVELKWNSEHHAYGYFDAFDGFVIPPAAALCRCRVNFDWWLAWLSSHLGLVNTGRPLELVGDHAWDIGDLWVTNRTKVPVVFARRVRGAILAELRTALDNRPGRAGGLILCSSIRPAAGVPWPHRFVPISIKQTLRPSDLNWSIDLDVLKGPYTGARPVASDQLICLSPDNRTFTIGDSTLLLRSRNQQALVRLLFDAYCCGERRRASEVMSQAGYATIAIEKALRNTDLGAVLRKHLRREKGLCWIEV